MFQWQRRGIAPLPPPGLPIRQRGCRIKRHTSADYETAFVLGDLHFPWQNDRAIEVALGIAEELAPNLVVINGDATDCWDISKFDKNPACHDKAKLSSELNLTRDFLARLRKRFQRARIVYVFGNHEHRWAVFIASNARELHGLKGMTLQEQLELDQHRIECVYSGNKETSWQWGKLLIGHFDAVSKHSGYTAKNLLDSKGISLIQNHTHRGGSSFKRLWDRDVVAYENFCLCDRNPAYVDHPNWQLGFSIVYKDRKSDCFSVEQHPIVEIVNGDRTTLKAFFNCTLFVN
ncbi:MAG: metallophosphoesterase [Acidobacteriia bacterium]|nr:metallophosphoesterase [Terriglobia bacterium]